MKYSKKILLGSVLWVFATGVYASAADLRVAGTILPPSCIPSFPAGNTYDLGTGSIRSLSETLFTSLPARDLSYRIECEAPLSIAYRVIDNRAGSSEGATGGRYSYGLGRQDTSNIGYANVVSSGSYTADGVGRYILVSSDAGLTWRTLGGNNGFNPTSYYAYTSIGGSLPEAFSRYEGIFRLEPRVRPVSQLDTDEEIVLDGLMTMEVVYL